MAVRPFRVEGALGGVCRSPVAGGLWRRDGGARPARAAGVAAVPSRDRDAGRGAFARGRAGARRVEHAVTPVARRYRGRTRSEGGTRGAAAVPDDAGTGPRPLRCAGGAGDPAHGGVGLRSVVLETGACGSCRRRRPCPRVRRRQSPRRPARGRGRRSAQRHHEGDRGAHRTRVRGGSPRDRD